VSTARLLGDLVLALRQHGHTVEVLTAAPHYRPDAGLSAAQPLRRVLRGLLYRSDYGGVPVWHVAIGRKRRLLFLRLAAFVVFHVASTVLALRLARRADMVMVVSPPPTVGLVGALVAASRGLPMVYHLQELYPDFLIHQGFLRNRLLVRAARGIERLIYRRSARIVVIGERFRQRLLALGVPAERIAVIPNFCLDHEVVDTGVAAASPMTVPLRVYYGGNIGLSQDWELLLAVAAEPGDPVEFTVSGDGARLGWLRAEVQRRGLTNVRVLGSVPVSEVGALLAASDIVAIPMLPLASLDTFPSKVFSAYAAGKPVVAAADEESDFARYVRSTGGGTVVTPGDVHGFASELQALNTQRGRLAAMRLAGLEASTSTTPEVCAARFDTLIREMLPDIGARMAGASSPGHGAVSLARDEA
jgi:colanic acid biosynthesis glycosyl transferase WcaI